MHISFSPPDISDLEINETIRTLQSGWITTGPKTKLLEQNLSLYCGTEKTACLSSATASLELTLRILGVGEGDEVITSAYTYTASASVIHHVGAKIVLVDTAKDSYEMDYDKMEQAITERTKAIISVDIAGVMCDYDRIMKAVQNKKHLFRPNSDWQRMIGRVAVIDDAAHSFGAVQKGKVNGTAADISCFSFHAVKNITTAEGGAVTWRKIEGLDSEALYHQYMLFSLHGQSKDAYAKSLGGSWEYDIEYLAYKYNMTDIMASLGLAQLERYPHILERRREIVRLYTEGLKGCPVEVLSHFGEDYSSSAHLFLMRLTGKDIEYRNAFIPKLGDKGISTNVHYKPLPMFTAYQRLGFRIEDFPNAYRQFENEITLPLHTLLSNEQIEYVCSIIEELLC